MEELDVIKFHGVTHVGERGQVVIPVGVRDLMKLGKGEKLLVFEVGRETIVFTKLPHIQKMMSQIGVQFKSLKNILNVQKSNQRKKRIKS